MTDLLFLSQRIPYPPNKGDKIRSWHILQHLARRHRVHLACFIDDPADWAYTDSVRAVCSGETLFVKLDHSLPTCEPLMKMRREEFGARGELHVERTGTVKWCKTKSWL